MRLSILLLGLIAVVWSQWSGYDESSEEYLLDESLETYQNVWQEAAIEAAAAPKLNCANDGFYVNGTEPCSCKPNFVNSICSQRVCQNTGQLRNTQQNFGCRCPPGFLGTNCEPVKCVPGSSNSFYQSSKQQSISLLIIYNPELVSKSQNDDVFAPFCQSFQDGGYSQAYVQIGSEPVIAIEKARTAVDCNQTIQNSIEGDCEDGACPNVANLTYSQILSTLERTLPNSQLFIVSTIPISDTDVNTRNIILAKATANRIQIHTLMYARATVANDDTYNGPLYQDTRTLAEATFGYFVTPYSAASINLYGTKNVGQTLTQLASLKSSGFDTILVAKSKGPAKPLTFIGGQELYLAFRTMDSLKIDDGTLKNDITWMSATTMTLIFDTGYFKIYKATQTDNLSTLLLSTNQLASFNFYILSKNGMKSYAAITTDDSVDAHAPYGIISGVSHKLTINALNPETTGINSVTVYTSDSSSSLYFNQNTVPRTGCQFTYLLGDIQCHDNLPVTILVKDQMFQSAAIPFYCVDSDMIIASQNTQVRLSMLEDDESTTQTIQTSTKAPVETPCTTPAGTPCLVKKSNDRSFVIIARQAKDANKTISTVDNLFVNPGNVFEKLVRFNKRFNATAGQSFYSSYVSNLVTATNPVTNTQGSTDFADYLSAVMDQVHNAVNNNASEIIDWRQAIEGLDYGNDSLKPFSDVFIVIDSPLSDNVKDRALLEKLYGWRLRLYFIFVGDGTMFTAGSDLTRQYTDLAFRTGGAVVTVPGFEQALQFFDQYFDSLWGLDVVTLYKRTESFFLKPSDPVWIVNPTGAVRYYLHVYADLPVQTTQFFDGNTEVKTINATSKYSSNYFAIYELTGSYPKNKITYRIQFLTNAEDVNVVLLTSSDDSLVNNIAFTSDANTDYVSGALQFGWPSKQYPVAIAPSASTLTLQDWNSGAPSVLIKTGGMQSRTGTKANYGYFMNYDWACDQSDNLYYARLEFFVDKTPYTRTQLFTCIEGGPCLHGGAVNADNSCLCPVGWVGSVCDVLVCLNNGVVQSDKTCKCQDGYQGDFCELSLSGCSNSPPKPDLRNVITSLAFVIDQSSPPMDFSKWTLPGVQIVVVTHGCQTNPQLVLSTTDPSLLSGALNCTQCTEDNLFDTLADAVVLALDSVVGDRSLVVVYTKSDDINPSTERWNMLRNRFTKQRAELRIYAERADIPDALHQLAQMGNGIVIQSGPQDNTISFSSYISTYVSSLFSTSTDSIPSQLSVVQSGSTSLAASTSVTIQGDPNDNAATSIIIHVWNTTATITSSDANNGSITANPFVFSTTNTVSYTIKFGSTNGKYSIEKLTNIQYSFGFQINGADEQLRLGLSPGDNFMSLYYSNVVDGHQVSTLPDILLTTIATNGTSSILVPTTHKDSNHSNSCTYQFYAANLVCTDAQTIYIAQLQSMSTSGIPRQHQKTFVCPNVDDASCTNGKLTNDICVCNANWEGVFCSLPICQNGGTREGQVCVCPVNTAGALCENNQARTTSAPRTAPTMAPTQTTKAPAHTRAFAFIIDTHGLDDTLYNMSETIVVEFLSMYSGQDTGSEKTLIYILSDNVKNGEAFLPYGGSNQVTQLLEMNIKSGRDYSGNPPDLVNAFQFISTAAKTYPGGQTPFVAQDVLTTVHNYIFYITSINASLSNRTVFDQLSKDYNFNMSVIGMVRYDELQFPEYSDLGNLTAQIQVYKNPDWYDAVKFMKNSVDATDYTIPPNPTPAGRQPACVSAVQSNTFLSIQIVNVPEMENYRTKMVEFASLFRSDFTPGPSVTGSDIPNGTFYRQQSFFNLWNCYDGTCSSTQGFCSNNFYGKYLNVTKTKKAKTADPNYARAMSYIEFFLFDDIHCTRFSDPETYKFVVWLWVSNFTGAEEFTSNITNNNYMHIFVPFGFDLDPTVDGFDATFPGQLLARNAQLKPGLKPQDMIIPHSRVNTVSGAQMVQDVWTMMCRVSNVIDAAATAAPPDPNAVQSADFYESNLLEEIY